jgi:hypothetical protein
MLYFQDVRDRPRYCASHVVPLEELAGDLSNAATTPNFAWIAPDDCADMEGCGIAAGDAFLKTELTEIMNSPAWRTQRSLAIITFDEDAADYQHPAQRVPTIVLASAGVKAGYSGPTRHTHYSLLRTIEAALGLGTLTANDRYAQPLNNIFHAERALFPAPQSALSTWSTATPTRLPGSVPERRLESATRRTRSRSAASPPVTEQSPEILALRAARAGVSVAEIERRLGAAIGIGRLVTAEEVAAVVVFLASPKSVAINGDAIAVGGGADRPALLLSPRGPWA